MVKYALWVHGTSVQAQRQGYFLSQTRLGNGARFQTHGQEWFHFAIPTPVIIASKDSLLEKVFVLYLTEGTAKITRLHVWDGNTRLHAFENLYLIGDHSSQLDASNSWTLPIQKHIKFGLGISVHVDFGPPAPQGVPVCQFVTAGADFLIA